MATAVPAMSASQLHLAYGATRVTKHLDIALERGQITAIVGPNGCGKSTILRSLARLLRPVGGAVYLHGEDIQRLPAKTLARQLAALPQAPEIPAGVTVWELVRYGRFPHQGLLRSRSRADVEAMEWAVAATGMEPLRDRAVDTLSGGERQRAWIAMALAQQTRVLLLDEPTTFLDIHYQMDIRSLVRRLKPTARSMPAAPRSATRSIADCARSRRKPGHRCPFLFGSGAARISAGTASPRRCSTCRRGATGGRLEARHLPHLVRRDVPVANLRGCYRGWAALSHPLQQIAEGEAFVRGDWAWTECDVTPSEPPAADAVAAEVTFSYDHAARGERGAITVAVRQDGTVTTQLASTEPEPSELPRYRTIVRRVTPDDGMLTSHCV